MDNFKYKVALPAPSFYGQFKTIRDVNVILTAFLKFGFDEVFEVALAAQSVSEYTKNILPGAHAHLRGPLISSACPVIVKLICVRYPGLLDNVLKTITPVELAALLGLDKSRSSRQYVLLLMEQSSEEPSPKRPVPPKKKKLD